jgi:hypothetical protein
MVPAVLLLLTIVPATRADAAPLGPCGYVSVTLSGNTTTLPLVNSCTRATCVGLSAGPYAAGLGNTRVEEYTCLNV